MLFDQAIDIPKSLSSETITVELLPERIRYSLRIKKEDLTAVKKDTGLKLPLKICGSSTVENTHCIKLGPDEWFVIADVNDKTKLDKLFAKISKNYVCSVTDVSHRNVGFDILGQDAAKLVNVGCPLDLSLEAFPIGKATRTVFESAQIMLLRTGDDRFTVECWRSFAPYLRDYFVRVMTTR